MRLVQLTRSLLLREGASAEEESWVEGLRGHGINVLTTLPPVPAYQQLSKRLAEDEAEGEPAGLWMGRDPRGWEALLSFLERGLGSWVSASPSLVPILLVLTELAASQRSARKWLRWKVLPPLASEVMRRPEEGGSLRNRLTRLMTSADGQTPHLAAEFLFQLCKRSVDRLIKYTGFGNAAGLLANNGFLGGVRTKTLEEGSSDEDSDTEEYRAAKPQYSHPSSLLSP